MTSGDMNTRWPHAPARWRADAQDDQWSVRLLVAVLKGIELADRNPPVISVCGAEVVHDVRGEPLLALVYARRGTGGLVGYRRVARQLPAVSNGCEDPAEDTADWIVKFDLLEPLGTRILGVQPDSEGVRWWGAPVG